MMNLNIAMNSTAAALSASTAPRIPQWIVSVHNWRTRVFLRIVEPIIVIILGPVEEEGAVQPSQSLYMNTFVAYHRSRRLSILPNYVEDVNAFRETSMSFATLAMLFLIMTCTCLIFLSCFYHNQKTSPLFISPRRHRLPKLVPPPLPVEGPFNWVKICFLLSDEEIINRVGYDSLIFLGFHRLALRCIVKMSVFSFIVLLPLNFTGGGHANANNLKTYVGSLLFTDFLCFTMANVTGGSPRLWVHCFAAYLLTGIVIRELLVEYEAFNGIRHRYLLSREPHLRTVLVSNIPRHLRSPSKVSTYFQHVYPQAIKSVTMCQNLIGLEKLIAKRTALLTRMEQELLLLCRAKKRKLFISPNSLRRFYCCGSCFDEGRQELLTKLYLKLEEVNDKVEKEQNRRRRVMKKLDQMEANSVRSKDIDYILSSPFLHESDAKSLNSYRPPSIGAPRNPDGTLATCDQVHNEGMLDTVEEEGLRSRSMSPSPHHPQDSIISESNKKRKKKDVMEKAKHAIKQYSRLGRNVNFFGRPIHTSYKPSEGDLEDHVNEVTDKAFIVMRTFTASTIAIQSMHSSKPGAMQVSTAPEPRDILWENIYVSKGATRTRSFIGEMLVLLLIFFYVVPVALVSLLVSESALVSSSPRLAQLDQASALFSSAIAMVQPLCIVGIQQLLPPLFILIGRLEGMNSFSEVQMRAFSRYFLFQVLNVFLVTTIAGSIFDTMAIILDSPETIFEMLGNSLPRMSSFFITFVTIKTFLGLGMELVRTMSLMQSFFR